MLNEDAMLEFANAVLIMADLMNLSGDEFERVKKHIDKACDLMGWSIEGTGPYTIQNRSGLWQVRNHKGSLVEWGMDERTDFNDLEDCRKAIAYYFDTQYRDHAPYFEIYFNNKLVEKVEREPEE